jgi:hypothetical protein
MLATGKNANDNKYDNNNSDAKYSKDAINSRDIRNTESPATEGTPAINSRRASKGRIWQQRQKFPAIAAATVETPTAIETLSIQNVSLKFTKE